MEFGTKQYRVGRLAVGAVVIILAHGINLAAVPAAPGNLTAVVNGGTVQLAWSAPPGQVQGYRVEAGSGPGQNNLHSGVYGPTSQLIAQSVAPGFYYVRVKAIASDGEGPASNEVLVTVGGSAACAAPPSAPTGLTATVNGGTVTFAWAAGPGCPASNYALQAGSAPGMSNLAIANVGSALSLISAAPAGTYHVRVIAQNAYGASVPSNPQVVTIGGSNGGGSTPGGGTVLTPLTGTVSIFGYRILSVTMPISGEYRAVLTWNDPTIDLDLYLSTTSCTSYPPTTACMRAQSAASAGNMEQVSYAVQAGQTYYVWVDNFTHRQSNYLVQHTVNGAAISTPQSDEREPLEIKKIKP